MDGYWDNVCPWQSALKNLSCKAEQARHATRHAMNSDAPQDGIPAGCSSNQAQP